MSEKPFSSPIKRYPLSKSPLFRLRGVAKFKRILLVDWEASKNLLCADNFQVWTNNKGREIQAPNGWLKHVHKRIAVLLGRIELPDYVFSQKGRSYIDNARVHAQVVPLVKTDICKFYPSVTRQMVFLLFKDTFECSIDIAHRLADICCYKQSHIPTGSSLSGPVSFFVAQELFDELNTRAKKADCVMSLYVDDLSFSGRGANKHFLGLVRKTISAHGFNSKSHKSKTFAAHAAKPITGTVLVGEDVRLPNKRHQQIVTAREVFGRAVNASEKEKAERVLKGRLQEASQFGVRSI